MSVIPIDDFFHAVEERQTAKQSPYRPTPVVPYEKEETVSECSRKTCHEPAVEGKKVCHRHYDAVMVGQRAAAESRIGKRVGEYETPTATDGEPHHDSGLGASDASVSLRGFWPTPESYEHMMQFGIAPGTLIEAPDYRMELIETLVWRAKRELEDGDVEDCACTLARLERVAM